MSDIASQKKTKNGQSRWIDRLVPMILLLIASISIVTTVGIVVTLIVDASHFFSEVPLREVFSTELAPLNAKNPRFGFLPLIMGTIVTSLIAMVVAVPIGLSAAIYLSEFASTRMRKLLKPIIELLAGIPTIVYGFFAYSFVTPLLMRLIPTLGSKNALSPGIVMGIMIIPIVTSLSEDAMSAVPSGIREAAIGMGSTKLEAAVKVIVPAGMSGIIASFVLAISRAIGETMIVTIASGSAKNFTLDVTQPMQTMTAYIVEFTSGDAGTGTTGYYSLYAVGLILFIFTLLMNMLARFIIKRYRKEY
jgi:phosphate transport system permease protein